MGECEVQEDQEVSSEATSMHGHSRAAPVCALAVRVGALGSLEVWLLPLSRLVGESAINRPVTHKGPRLWSVLGTEPSPGRAWWEAHSGPTVCACHVGEGPPLAPTAGQSLPELRREPRGSGLHVACSHTLHVEDRHQRPREASRGGRSHRPSWRRT